MSKPKGMPLTKEEIMLLVQKVEANPVIFSKATNASNNQLKDVTWSKITDDFNSLIVSSPRTPEQLRLKWENLKKAARKRSTKIRMNNLKTGGGKPDYIPPDEALDKVAAILGSTCEGYSVQFGGDAVVEEVEEMVQEAVVVDVPFDVENTPPVIVSPALSPHTPQPKKILFSSTISKGKLTRQTLTEDVKKSVKTRNLAIAEYYDAKRKKEEEIFVLKKRKLELEILEQEQKLEEKNKL
ncbi:unnamed protein product [Euphydryas editha]|uniref:Regulatory protein zeste n=1 Tax=Euphydryas editha TaxID=104508 RepID=A0AAU9TJB2_EUPED|nr:unnamed protein product [Euphydryas editha]CAH2101958.1 unnamed protein product [Euphydryas editha]